MIEMMIDLQGGAKAPLYEKIYEYIKTEIVEGKIKKGEKLPSTRLLAVSLAVSRSTVEMAYDQLFAEGYIKSEPCRGFFVCDVSRLYHLGGNGSSLRKECGSTQSGGPAGKEGLADQRLARAVLREEGSAQGEQTYRVDFSPYAIDTASFPFHIWRKLSRNVLLDDTQELLLAGDGRGEYELRSAIAGYLHHARGVNCDPAHMILGAGNEYLEILLAQLLGGKKTVLMEDPGYPQAYRTFCNMGYEVRTVAAGEMGLDAAQIQGEEADIVYIMPSHQFPLGSVMPLRNRLELLKWATEREERYLIEDDHDSEYRYRGKPLPSLQSVDRYGKVIYLGTFSKSIAPSLRISYMVLPPKLMERYLQTCGFYSTTVPRMQQEILRAFIGEGYFERHLNKMRGVYRSRHDYLLGELKKRDWAVRVRGEHAGLHVLVEVDTEFSEWEICKKAKACGVLVSGLSDYRLGTKEFGEESGLLREGAERPGGTDARRAAGTGKQMRQERRPALLLGYGKLREDELREGLSVLDGILMR